MSESDFDKIREFMESDPELSTSTLNTIKSILEKNAKNRSKFQSLNAQQKLPSKWPAAFSEYLNTKQPKEKPIDYARVLVSESDLFNEKELPEEGEKVTPDMSLYSLNLSEALKRYSKIDKSLKLKYFFLALASPYTKKKNNAFYCLKFEPPSRKSFSILLKFLIQSLRFKYFESFKKLKSHNITVQLSKTKEDLKRLRLKYSCEKIIGKLHLKLTKRLTAWKEYVPIGYEFKLFVETSESHIVCQRDTISSIKEESPMRVKEEKVSYTEIQRRPSYPINFDDSKDESQKRVEVISPDDLCNSEDNQADMEKLRKNLLKIIFRRCQIRAECYMKNAILQLKSYKTTTPAIKVNKSIGISKKNMILFTLFLKLTIGKLKIRELETNLKKKRLKLILKKKISLANSDLKLIFEIFKKRQERISRVFNILLGFMSNIYRNSIRRGFYLFLSRIRQQKVEVLDQNSCDSEEISVANPDLGSEIEAFDRQNLELADQESFDIKKIKEIVRANEVNDSKTLKLFLLQKVLRRWATNVLHISIKKLSINSLNYRQNLEFRTSAGLLQLLQRLLHRRQSGYYKCLFKFTFETRHLNHLKKILNNRNKLIFKNMLEFQSNYKRIISTLVSKAELKAKAAEKIFFIRCNEKCKTKAKALQKKNGKALRSGRPAAQKKLHTINIKDLFYKKLQLIFLDFKSKCLKNESARQRIKGNRQEKAISIIISKLKTKVLNILIDIIKYQEYLIKERNLKKKKYLRILGKNVFNLIKDCKAKWLANIKLQAVKNQISSKSIKLIYKKILKIYFSRFSSNAQAEKKKITKIEKLNSKRVLRATKSKLEGITVMKRVIASLFKQTIITLVKKGTIKRAIFRLKNCFRSKLKMLLALWSSHAKSRHSHKTIVDHRTKLLLKALPKIYKRFFAVLTNETPKSKVAIEKLVKNISKFICLRIQRFFHIYAVNVKTLAQLKEKQEKKNEKLEIAKKFAISKQKARVLRATKSNASIFLRILLKTYQYSFNMVKSYSKPKINQKSRQLRLTNCVFKVLNSQNIALRKFYNRWHLNEKIHTLTDKSFYYRQQLIFVKWKSFSTHALNQKATTLLVQQKNQICIRKMFSHFSIRIRSIVYRLLGLNVTQSHLIYEKFKNLIIKCKIRFSFSAIRRFSVKNTLQKLALSRILKLSQKYIRHCFYEWRMAIKTVTGKISFRPHLLLQKLKLICSRTINQSFSCLFFSPQCEPTRKPLRYFIKVIDSIINKKSLKARFLLFKNIYVEKKIETNRILLKEKHIREKTHIEFNHKKKLNKLNALSKTEQVILRLQGNLMAFAFLSINSFIKNLKAMEIQTLENKRAGLKKIQMIYISNIKRAVDKWNSQILWMTDRAMVHYTQSVGSLVSLYSMKLTQVKSNAFNTWKNKNQPKSTEKRIVSLNIQHLSARFRKNAYVSQKFKAFYRWKAELIVSVDPAVEKLKRELEEMKLKVSSCNSELSKLRNYNSFLLAKIKK